MRKDQLIPVDFLQRIVIYWQQFHIMSLCQCLNKGAPQEQLQLFFV